MARLKFWKGKFNFKIQSDFKLIPPMYFKDLRNQWVLLINSFFFFVFNAIFCTIQRLINSLSSCYISVAVKGWKEFPPAPPLPPILVCISQVLMYLLGTVYVMLIAMPWLSFPYALYTADSGFDWDSTSWAAPDLCWWAYVSSDCWGFCAAFLISPRAYSSLSADNPWGGGKVSLCRTLTPESREVPVSGPAGLPELLLPCRRWQPGWVSACAGPAWGSPWVGLCGSGCSTPGHSQWLLVEDHGETF